MRPKIIIGFLVYCEPFGNYRKRFLDRCRKFIKLGSILAVHAESTVITEQLAAQKQLEGKLTSKDFCVSRPIVSEMEAVRRIISYAEATGCKLHIVHASRSKVVGLITEAKERGVDVTVETCSHYLSLTVDDLAELGPIAKCCPPLRDQEEVEALWASFANREIDVIGSDHSPAPPSMKALVDGDMFKAWGGISGAQSTLSILLEEGYWKRNVSLERIVEATSTNPAKRFGLHPYKGNIAEGSDADFSIINLDEKFQLKKEDLFYRHPHSPYIGKVFRGKNVITIVDGSIVYKDGQIISQKQLKTIQ